MYYSNSARGKGNINNSISIGIGLSSSRGGGQNSSRRGNNNNGSGLDSNRPQLLDAYGRNLTPKPLIPAKSTDGNDKTNDKGTNVGSRSGAVGMTRGSDNGSVHSDYNENMSEGGFTEDSDNENNEEEVQESAMDNEEGTNVNSLAQSAIDKMNGTTNGWTRTEEEMEAIVTLTLRETPTTIVFALPAIRVLQDTPQHKEVLAANERYDQMCSNIQKGGAELYPSRGVQTLNKSTKNKEIGTVSPGTRTSEAQVDNWDIYDSKQHMLAMEHMKNNPDTTNFGPSATAAKRNTGLENVVDAVVSVSLATPGCLIDADGAVNILPPVAAPVKKSNKYDPNLQTSQSALSSSNAGSSNANRNQQTKDPSKPTDAPVARGWGMDSRSSAISNVSFSGRMGSAGNNGGTGLGDNDENNDKTKTNNNDDDGVGPLDVVVQQQANRIFRSRSLFDNLALVERAIQQNLYHESHRKYRSGPAQDLLDTLLEAGLKGGHNGAAAILAAQSSSSSDENLSARKGRTHKKGTSGHLIEGSAEEAEADEEPIDTTTKPVPPVASSDGNEEKKEDSAVDHEKDDNNEENEDNEHNEEKKEDPATTTTETQPTDITIPTDHTKPVTVGPSLLPLWTYKCPEVAGLNVTGMAWNNANRDLLAVSYGPYDFSQAYTGRGYIALWNLSNPEFPQAILTTPEGTGVTAIDFSQAHPSLLAAGMYNGCVCVYDVAKILTGKADSSPALVSDKLQTGSHTEAVWQVKWVHPPDEQPGTEVIVSVSTDGRVTEWSIKKGLSPSLLMVLKRARAAPDPNKASLPNSTTDNTKTNTGNDPSKTKTNANANSSGSEALGATGSEGLLSRTASGLAFDFPSTDTSQYLVGTEDGLLARCSISYSEQYLDVTQAHSGPINRVRLSPYLSHACLTASSDWSVRLWSVNIGGSSGTSSALSMRPITYSTDEVHDAVTDVAWSPSVSTRFASVTRDGHVQVWDAVQLQPLLDSVVSIDNEEWEAIQAKEAAVRATLIQKLVEEERNRRKIASGGELDEEEDSIERITAFVTRKLALEEGKEIVEEEDDDDAKSVDSADTKPKKSTTHHASTTVKSRGPPRKKFSTVLFADNTHVLLTGDSSGNVDVYRIVGLGATPGHDEDLLAGGGGTSIPMVGSEEFHHQVDALQSILQTI